MKLGYIWSFAAILTLIALGLGAWNAELPLIQYLGNTTGVLLGFVLSVLWHEEVKKRAKQESVGLFWREFADWLHQLDNKSTSLKSDSVGPIYARILESRLPVIEANHLLRWAGDLELNTEFRRNLAAVVSDVRVIDDYLDLGVERLNHQKENLSSKLDRLREKLPELKKYPK